MFRIKSNITITQRKSTRYPTHNRVLRLYYLNAFNWLSTWTNQTSTGKIIIPKNLFFKDSDNASNPLNGTKVNIGGFNSEPLFMRGDKVQLSTGYKYFNKNNTEVTEVSEVINGYISKVYSKVPIEIEIEDNMWLLKQTPMDTRTFTNSDTLESLLAFICDSVNEKHGTNLTYKALTKTTYGTTLVGNETAAQLLGRLKRLYGFTAYFRDDELRCGVITHSESDAKKVVFIMNGKYSNIPLDGQDLEYQRKDDIVLSAVAHNTITESDGFCKDGTTPKTKHTRLEVLVTYRNGEKTTKVISRGDRVADNDEGERRTFFFPEATTTDRLKELAFEQLDRYYYDGLKGKFTTFGIPYVRHGDNVELKNPKLPEQDGVYKVKGVEYEGSASSGLRQIIELDYKIT